MIGSVIPDLAKPHVMVHVVTSSRDTWFFPASGPRDQILDRSRAVFCLLSQRPAQLDDRK